jgi:hypothetical protein
MNIYCELLLDRIRIKIDGEELVFQVNSGFYAHRMLVATGVGSRILGYVRYHQSDFNWFQRIKHTFVKNKVFILVNQDVQQYITLRQVHEFAARFLKGGTMYIIPKPASFDSSELESIGRIRKEHIKGSENRDAMMSQLKSVTQRINQRPAFK